MKSVLRSKVFWLAVIQGIAGVLVAVETQYPTAGALLIAKSLVDIVLRMITTEQVKM